MKTTNTPLRVVFSTLFSVFGFLSETLFFVFDKFITYILLFYSLEVFARDELFLYCSLTKKRGILAAVKDSHHRLQSNIPESALFSPLPAFGFQSVKVNIYIFKTYFFDAM